MVRGTARSLATALTLRSTAVRSLAYESQLHRTAAREPEGRRSRNRPATSSRGSNGATLAS